MASKFRIKSKRIIGIRRCEPDADHDIRIMECGHENIVRGTPPSAYLPYRGRCPHCDREAACG